MRPVGRVFEAPTTDSYMPLVTKSHKPANELY